MIGPDRNPLAVHFGNNLRTCRNRAGLSQEKLGLRASLHRTEVGLLERGRREPRLDTIMKLADALEVPPSALLDGIEWTSTGGFAFRVQGDAPR